MCVRNYLPSHTSLGASDLSEMKQYLDCARVLLLLLIERRYSRTVHSVTASTPGVIDSSGDAKHCHIP